MECLNNLFIKNVPMSMFYGITKCLAHFSYLVMRIYWTWKFMSKNVKNIPYNEVGSFEPL